MKRVVFILAALQSVTLYAQQAQFSHADFVKLSNSSSVLGVETDAAGNAYSVGYFYGDMFLPAETLTAAASSIGSGFIWKKKPDGSIEWAKLFGGEARATSVKKSSDNFIYVAGVIRNSMTFNGTTYPSTGKMDVFLAKLNPAGQTVWLKQGSGSADASQYNGCAINDLVVDANGNVYFTGFFTDSLKFGNQRVLASGVNDIMTGKFNSNGDLLWIKRAGGSYGGDCGLPNNDNGAAIALDNANGVYITGHYAFNLQVGTENFTASSTVDAYVAKYDRDGNFLWAKSMGGVSWDVATSVACDANNNVFVAGNFKENMIINGHTYTSVSGWGSQYDIFIIKMDSQGNYLWAKQEGGNLSEYANRIAVDYAGNLYVGGNMDGESNIADSVITASPHRCFIAKYNNQGQPVYLAAGGGASNNLQAFVLDRNNDIYLGGSMVVHPNTPGNFGSFTIAPTSNYIFNAMLDDPFNSMFDITEFAAGMSAHVFPNPAKDVIHITWAETSPNTTISIYDMSGKAIGMYTSQIDVLTIPVADFSSGMYFYTITQQGAIRSSGKFIVE